MSKGRGRGPGRFKMPLLALAACAGTLSSADPLSSADSTPVDVLAIVQRSLQHESFDLDPPTLPDYTYVVDDEEKRLNADGSVKSTNSETREVMNLYGGHFERLIRKNGQELPADKARTEQGRFDKAVEKRKRELEQLGAHATPEMKAKWEEAGKKALARKVRCNEEFLKMFDLRPAGSEALNGRTAWMVDLNPHSNANPAAECGGDMKMMGKFHIKLWIDQEEYRWARLEADNVFPVSLGKILIRVPAGAMYFLYEQTRHEDGVWLTSRDRVKGYAKIMLAAPFRVDETETYSAYRKFQAESRMVTADEGK
jgi:hypothetical protein